VATLYTRGKNTPVDAEKLFNEVIIELSPEEVGNVRRTWRPKRILLVDDESLFNFLHKRMLELTGISKEIHTTFNGVQAIEYLKANCWEGKLPDVILLDLSMPVMDGFAFLEAFSAIDFPNKKKISIVIITSSIDGRDRVRARELGVTRYLIKPVDERELCAAIVGA
jgi:CheY-like chemotaxis protein